MTVTSDEWRVTSQPQGVSVFARHLPLVTPHCFCGPM